MQRKILRLYCRPSRVWTSAGDTSHVETKFNIAQVLAYIDTVSVSASDSSGTFMLGEATRSARSYIDSSQLFESSTA